MKRYFLTYLIPFILIIPAFAQEESEEQPAEKFELDVHYVDNQSFLLDLKILLKTIKNVLILL